MCYFYKIYIYKTNGSGQYLDANGAVLANQTDPALRVIKERKLPGMWLDLKNSYFQQKNSRCGFVWKFIQ